jgi:hypothetical protein
MSETTRTYSWVEVADLTGFDTDDLSALSSQLERGGTHVTEQGRVTEAGLTVLKAQARAREITFDPSAPDVDGPDMQFEVRWSEAEPTGRGGTEWVPSSQDAVRTADAKRDEGWDNVLVVTHRERPDGSVQPLGQYTPHEFRMAYGR